MWLGLRQELWGKGRGDGNEYIKSCCEWESGAGWEGHTLLIYPHRLKSVQSLSRLQSEKDIVAESALETTRALPLLYPPSQLRSYSKAEAAVMTEQLFIQIPSLRSRVTSSCSQPI